MIVLIILLLALAFLLRVDFIWYIVYVCLGIYVWSRWITPRLIKKITLERRYQDHAFLGEQVPITLLLTSGSRIPVPWAQYFESVPPELKVGELPREALSLPGRKTHQRTYFVRAKRRGYYRLGPMKLTGGDLFGFQESQAVFPANFLTVYPQILPISQLGLPSRLPFGTLRSKQRLFEDPARPIGVRNYVSGDSQRHINWKVSAHASSLLVKTFEPAISLESFILLNLNKSDYSLRFQIDGPEWAIVVAASVAAHLVSQRQAVGLAANGLDPLIQDANFRLDGSSFDEYSGRLLLRNEGRPLIGEEEGDDRRQTFPYPILPKPGRPHLMKVLEILARIESQNQSSFTNWLPGVCLNLSWGVTIIAITPDADAKVFQALHRLLRAGYNPVLIIIEPYVNFPAILQHARQLGFTAFYIPDREAMASWRHKLRDHHI